jgi:hypothetical protein
MSSTQTETIELTANTTPNSTTFDTEDNINSNWDDIPDSAVDAGPMEDMGGQ